MVGHPHWAGIKHKKALVDAKRASEQASKAIIVAPRRAAATPTTTLGCAQRLTKRELSVFRKTILLRYQRGIGELDPVELEAAYEGYGLKAPRSWQRADTTATVLPEIRKIFEICGGNISSQVMSHGT